MKKALFSLLLFLFTHATFATHNRAGEITYRRIAGFSYEITLTTYTKESSVAADRNSLVIRFGDGDTLEVNRLNGPDLNGDGTPDGESLGNDIKKNVYRAQHTYPGAGKYLIQMNDPNRNGGIENIPNSINVSFTVQSELIVNAVLGNNSSPVLLNPPIDDACAFKCFLHNPGAVDPDGDSLTYELVSCLADDGLPIPGFTQPNVFGGGSISINATTGDLLWCSPAKLGEYNVAILIREYRKGFLIGSILRDMQITVKTCQNNAPSIAALQDTCIEAGTQLNINVTATDPDNDIITLSATGAPFITNPSATFTTVSALKTVSQVFRWRPDCNQIRRSPYTVSFKVSDNDPQVSLVDFKSLRITVVGPAVVNLSAVAIGSSIRLTWNKNRCPQVLGYSIYRRKGCVPFVVDPCFKGVDAASGYELVGSTNAWTDTTFLDTNNGLGLGQAIEYAYIVVSNFPDGSVGYPSANVCAQLKRDVPVITHVSVESTDAANGSIRVRWVKPRVGGLDLDTTQLIGPYRFRLLQAAGSPQNFNTVIDFDSPYFKSLTDTQFVQSGLNTQDLTYYYKVEFYANQNFVGATQVASSVYLTIQPSDNALTLQWNPQVPWLNYQTYIYKEITTGTFALIDSTTTLTYTDTNLVNGRTYCYKVETFGNYSDPGIQGPLRNFSQIKCGQPKDTQAPCAPSLTAQSNCEDLSLRLSWRNQGGKCSEDVVGYKIYYAATDTDSLRLLQSFNAVTDTSLAPSLILSIAGCYAVSAVDSFANESVWSNRVCIDNCPVYSLPNVFTPNGDGINDLFVPFPYRSVKDIALTIYNRWGSIVFQTKDPAILWDGKNKDTNLKVSDGVYYYVCTVNEIRLAGIVQRELKGFVQVLDKK